MSTIPAADTGSSRFVTLDHVAAELCCSRRTILNHATAGTIRSVIIAARRLVPRDEFERLCREGLTGPAAPIAEAAPAQPKRGRGRPRKVPAIASAGVAA